LIVSYLCFGEPFPVFHWLLRNLIYQRR